VGEEREDEEDDEEKEQVELDPDEIGERTEKQ
jgi:hypothetical protein